MRTVRRIKSRTRLASRRHERVTVDHGTGHVQCSGFIFDWKSNEKKRLQKRCRFPATKRDTWSVYRFLRYIEMRKEQDLYIVLCRNLEEQVEAAIRVLISGSDHSRGSQLEILAFPRHPFCLGQTGQGIGCGKGPIDVAGVAENLRKTNCTSWQGILDA